MDKTVLLVIMYTCWVISYGILFWKVIIPGIRRQLQYTTKDYLWALDGYFVDILRHISKYPLPIDSKARDIGWNGWHKVHRWWPRYCTSCKKLMWGHAYYVKPTWLPPNGNGYVKDNIIVKRFCKICYCTVKLIGEIECD